MGERMRTLRNTPYAILVLIAAPLILFWRIVLGGRVLFWGVPLLQFYPWQQWAAEMWRSGNVPLWNPYLGNGAPLAANLQSAVFYPLNALYLIFPVERAMSYTAVLHVILAGLAMYAWGRTFGLRPLAATMGALAFQLSQFLIARLGFLSITFTFPWLAVWLWRTEALVQRRRMSDALWLALAIGLGLLAGHAQTAGLGLIVVLGYGVIRRIPNTQYQVLGIGYWMLALVLGVALAAVQLLPSAELAAQSQRAGGLDYEFAVIHSLHPLRLLTFLAPDLQGHPAEGNFWGYDNYWENAGYVGLWAVLMALFALSNLKSQISNLKSEVWFFGLTALIALVIALGRFGPVYEFLFWLLPGAALFQGPARLLSVYTLAVAALAGIGTEQWLASQRLRVVGRFLIVAALGVLLAVVVGGLFVGVRSVFIRPAIQFGVTLGACAACLAFRPSAEDRRFRGWAAALIGVVTLDLLVADWRLVPTTDVALYRTSIASAQAVRDGRVLWFSQDEERFKFERYFSFAGFGPEEATHWLGVRESLLPNTAMIERIYSANNFDSLLPQRYHELKSFVDRLPLTSALRVAVVMNARYVVSARQWPLPVVHRSDELVFYRNDAAMERAYIVPQARVVNNTLAALAAPTFDPRRQVLLESVELPVLEFPAGPSSVVLQDSPNAVTIRATSESGGFLVLADTFYPGWQATLDGTPVEILRANHAFRTVVLPPGEHTVVFRYEPTSFRVGAAISLTTAGVVILLLSVLWLRQRRSSG